MHNSILILDVCLYSVCRSLSIITCQIVAVPGLDPIVYDHRDRYP